MIKQMYTYEEVSKLCDEAYKEGLSDGKRLAERARQEAADDLCNGCAFFNNNEWEMPCAKCKRGCKDFWRAASLKTKEEEKRR